MMSNEKKPRLGQRVIDSFRLVRSLVGSGHDIEALDAAKTILNRSLRAFSFDPAVDKPGVVECSPGEFARALSILKCLEGNVGAAIDGGRAENGSPHRNPRVGTEGMQRRREAMLNASKEIARETERSSPIRRVFAEANAEWRWRESGWFHGLLLGDFASLLSQPVVVFVAPGRETLERAATILEQLLVPPSTIPGLLARAIGEAPGLPYAAVLLDSAGPNPPAVMELLKAFIRCRREARKSGWVIPDIEIVVIGGDPVWSCATEWLGGGEAEGAFSAAWMKALAGEGSLGAIHHAATAQFAATAVIEQLTGEKPAIFENATEGSTAEECGEAIRYVVTREDKLHFLAEHLRRNAGETDVEFVTMDSVRRIDQAKVNTTDFKSICEIELPAGPVSAVFDTEWPRAVFSEDERKALVEKWTARPDSTSEEIYIFPHIPKTAGSSVHFHLKSHLAYDREYIHIPIDNTTNEDLRRRTPFTLRDQRDRARVRVIFGHGVIRRHAAFVPGKKPLEIVTLRDPVDRALSHYNFWMNVLEKRG